MVKFKLLENILDAINMKHIAKQFTTDKFIDKSNKIHNFKYNYSLSIYTNSKTKLDIICASHGIFSQIPNAHLMGHGCSKCRYENNAKKRGFTTNTFIERAIDRHGTLYDYTHVNYNGYNTKINILCNKHGIFHQTPHKHLSGEGCPRCVGKHKTTEIFISEANIIHGNKFNYSEVVYNGNKTPIVIICREHGKFSQSPSSHLNGRGCPVCVSSKGEIKIETYLKTNNINYIKQKTFSDCKGSTKWPLKFDFYLPDRNILIEYDGAQHFISGGRLSNGHLFSPEEINNIKMRDDIKTKYASCNNIKLIRIPYWKLETISSMLDELL